MNMLPLDFLRTDTDAALREFMAREERATTRAAQRADARTRMRVLMCSGVDLDLTGKQLNLQKRLKTLKKPEKKNAF